jgi:hypothetical protein
MVDFSYSWLIQRMENIWITLLNDVEEGYMFNWVIIRERADKGFIGIFYNLKEQTDDFLNPLPFYLRKKEDINLPIDRHDNIRNYNIQSLEVNMEELINNTNSLTELKESINSFPNLQQINQSLKG